jgi:RNA polymerase-binding transcription factor DksA
MLRMRRELMQEVQDAAAACRKWARTAFDIGDMSSQTYSRDVLLNLAKRSGRDP